MRLLCLVRMLRVFNPLCYSKSIRTSRPGTCMSRTLLLMALGSIR